MNPDDVSIAVPPGWQHATDLDQGILVAARAPATPPSGFVPTFVLDAEPVEVDLDRWQRRAATHLAELLEGFELEDTDDYHLGDEAVRYCRIAFRTGEHDVVCEQWCWLVQGIGFTLSCTVAREDHAELTDLFEDVATTFSVRDGPARPGHTGRSGRRSARSRAGRAPSG